MDITLSQAIQALVVAKPTWAVIALVGINFVLGVITALKDRVFTWQELSDIFSKVAPIAIGYTFLGVSSEMALTQQLGDAVQTLIAVVAGMPFLVSSIKDVKGLTVKSP